MKLEPGDLVCIIAPASQFRSADRGLLSQAVSLLESWHLQVEVRIDHEHHFYLAGPDAIRANHLHAALAHAEAKAIFCTRGGYGSSRLLRHLDMRICPTAKFLVGHSDITSLHLAVSGLWPQVISVHGPNVATRQLLGAGAECELNRQSLYDVLFADNRELLQPLEFLLPGRAAGPLQGGCLSLIASAIGTGFGLRPEGTIVFLEDIGEPPYRIDRMLTQMRNAGTFNDVRGVVFGAMTKCSDPYNDLKMVLRDFFEDLSVPIAFGLRSGHGEVNLSIRLGAHVEMDSAAGVVRIGSSN